MYLPPFFYDEIYELSTPVTAGTPAASSGPASTPGSSAADPGLAPASSASPPASPAPVPTPVTMDLILGSVGQSADWSAHLDDITLFDHELESQINVPLGDTSSLSGKVLDIIGNIVDMNDTDNNLNLDFNIRGGAEPLSLSFTVAGNPGDVVRFLLRVEFL